MKNKLHGSKASNLAWHPAFMQAIQLELSDYRDSLEFKYEYQLTAEPLRIDLLIIKKPKHLEIDKNIARLFRAVNLLEYKSPEDYLSVKDFFKVCSYANLYAAIIPEADLSDITITFIGNRNPKRLLKYLTGTRGFTIKETSPGIYLVFGDYIPIQIIESKKLSENENLWLKSLTNDLEIRNAGVILEAGKRQVDKTAMAAYLDILLRANPEIFMEVKTMPTRTKKRRTFEEVFTEAGIIPEWIAMGKAEGKAQGKTEGRAEERQYVLGLLNQGLSLEEIKQRLCG